jgi:hypothetical protein
VARSQAFDLVGVERTGPTELPDAGHDPVQAPPVPRMERGGRAPDENRAREERLQVTLCGEKPFPLRKFLEPAHPLK